MYDTIVIGAGAAGIAAAKTLRDAGKSVVVLEARNRIGGRTWTDETFAEFPVELGAEFIHGVSVITHTFVKEAGLSEIPVNRFGKLRWSNGDRAKIVAELPEDLRSTIEKLWQDYAEIVNTDFTRDTALAEYLKARGHNAESLQIADVLLAQTCVASVFDLSCRDLQRDMQNGDTHDAESRIREGYKAIFEYLSQGLEIKLSSPAHSIERHKAGLAVRTPNQFFEARTCIITLPVTLLQSSVVQFSPALSYKKQRAIHTLRMEAGTKLLYKFTEPFWDEDLTYMLHDDTAARWWTPGHGQPYHEKQSAGIIACYTTSSRARALDAFSEVEALNTGLKQLSKLLGVSFEKLEQNLVKSKRVAWAHDPYALGSYAHVPPGAAEARVDLAKSEGRLFFAGEATAYHSTPQTVHGAFDSGIRAAEEAIEE
jgi:monoamine oxidase